MNIRSVKFEDASQINARDDNTKIITVRVEDSEDLDEVSRVAWEIDKVLGDWKGMLQFLTDKETLNLTLGQGQGPKYSISSYSFIIGAIYGGTEKKTLAHF